MLSVRVPLPSPRPFGLSSRHAFLPPASESPGPSGSPTSSTALISPRVLSPSSHQLSPSGLSEATGRGHPWFFFSPLFLFPPVSCRGKVTHEEKSHRQTGNAHSSIFVQRKVRLRFSKTNGNFTSSLKRRHHPENGWSK